MKKAFTTGIVVMIAMVFFTSLFGTQDPEMMKKWQAFMTPGKYHKQLAHYTGNWSFDGKSWMDPKGPPLKASGTVAAEMILGGRYLKMIYKGTSMGMPFEGISITAFDNHLKIFHSIWIDNSGTGIFISKGKPGTEKVREETGVIDDPMGSGKVHMRTVYTNITKDRFKMEMFNKIGSSPETKSMELIYTRNK